MDIKKNLKSLNKKETALIYVLIIPLFFVLFIPAIAAFLIRNIFSVLHFNKSSKTIDRKPAKF